MKKEIKLIKTRHMRCFTSDGKRWVDIRIADQSDDSRKYVLLAAHVLTTENMMTDERVDYDYYALISKDENGNIIPPCEAMYVGQDKDENILRFDQDFTIIERSPIV